MKSRFLSGAALRALALPAVAIAALAVPVAGYAQETTSTIQGTVTRGGVAQSGIDVTVVHVPSGTRSTATTDASGSFTLSGLRVGGPYTIDAGGTQITDVSLTAGEAFSLPIELPAEAAADIVVTATRVVSARNISQGPVNVLTAAQIAQVASLSRDIRDLARRDPFATLDTSGTNRNVSFAGQNARYNRFTIDGVPITDGFGLNPDGLPSRRGPIPLDAIEQFQTKVAPYDVRDGFFQGGVVNAVLKSGTNKFQGTGFYSYSSDGLLGQRTANYTLSTTNGFVAQPKFKSYDFGAEISGPIIPDKLFFMVAAERVRGSRPTITAGTVETNAGNPTTGLTDATVAQIVSIAQTKYGYNAGSVLRSDNDRDDRLVARLDANLSDTQRASGTFIYTKDSINTLPNASTTTLGLSSNAYVKPNEVYAGIFQLNSQWSSNFSTEARLLYKEYNSGQFPLLGNIAQVNVCTAPTSDRPAPNGTSTATTFALACPTGTPQVVIGAQSSAQYNVLKTKTYGGSLQARLTLNDHSVRVLADYSMVKIYNLFVNGGRGTFYFDSIADFAAGNAQTYGYSNAVPSLDPNDAAARFGYQTYTFGIQDDWRVNDMLNISYGMRYDLFGGHSTPVLNPAFVSRYGISNTEFINGRGLFQPRFGFNFKPIPQLSIRGGGGIFGAGTPDVYVSNSFANSGVLTNSLTARITDGGIYQLNGTATSTAIGQALLNNISITGVPATANTQLAGGTLAATTSTASLDPNFRIPSQFRATLSADYRANLGPLGDGWRFGVDFFYSKVRDQVLFVDLRSVPVAGSFTPDGRQRYRGLLGAGDGNNDIQLTNSKLGRSYIGVVRFDKTFDFGVNIFGSYSLQDVKDDNSGTSSIAASNYNNGAYLDPNRAAYGTSNDQVRWAFKYGIGFDRTFFGENHTRFNLFGETRAGSPYSYGFRDNTNGRSAVFGTTGTNTRYLFYVPTSTTDPLITYLPTVANGVTVQTAAEAQARIDTIINGSGLNGWRGKVAPRNVFRSKAFTKIDLHAEQELPLPWGGKFTLFGDIENFTNLLNRNWGQQLRASFSYTKTVADVACVTVGTNTCAQYAYSNARSDVLLADQLAVSSLYAIRIGARISF